MTLEEAAERLGVHSNTIRNWIKRGVLEAQRLPDSPQRRGFRRPYIDSVEALAERLAKS